MRYSDAGVDISVADDAKQRIRTAAGRTFRRGVLSAIGGFGALFELDRKRWKDPILVASADGNYALTYNDSGIYATIGVSFQTPGGQTVQRPADQYKPFAAINDTANNFVTVADNAAKRRATIKDEIAQTTEQLQNATTDAEVQKLHGVLTSLNGDLASTDDEVNQAASSAMVQDIQNRNDQQKQIQALTEQQNAEFAESVSNYTAKFQLLDAPTTFPTP